MYVSVHLSVSQIFYKRLDEFNKANWHYKRNGYNSFVQILSYKVWHGSSWVAVQKENHKQITLHFWHVIVLTTYDLLHHIHELHVKTWLILWNKLFVITRSYQWTLHSLNRFYSFPLLPPAGQCLNRPIYGY